MFVAWKRSGWMTAWLLGAGLTVAVAQPAPNTSNRLSLEQCVDIAVKNNIQVRLGQLTIENTDLQLRQSRNNLLPTASFVANQSLSGGGRQIDPFTNAVIPQSTVNTSNYGLSGGFTIFNGFFLRNTVKQNDLALQASQKELAATQNTVALNVVQQYLNVLTGQEQLIVAQQQAAATQAQLDRTQRLVNAGSVPEANLFEVRAQLANDEVAIVNAQNQIDLAKLALLQAMNLPLGQPIDVVSVAVPDPSIAPYEATPQQIYEIALDNMPDVQGAELRVKSAVAGVQAARANFYPILSVNGSLNTLFTSTATRTTSIDTTNISLEPSGQFVILNNERLPVVSPIPRSTRAQVPYVDQLTNNLNRSATLSLRVPIVNGFQARNRVGIAKIQQLNAQLQAENIRLQLRQNIETAYTNMRASANRYRATQASVVSLERAFQVAESRLNAGAINATDYNVAKSNIDRARASLVQAKYDYVFRTKILDFYQNKPLSF